MICTLCPRLCHAERMEQEGKGVCRVGTLPRIARAALHMWEEPCISGTRGSGAIFFSGCNLQCAFCQNEVISHGGQGETVSVERLAEIFRELENQGAHNINLVTPTMFSPQINAALTLAKAHGLHIPVVYNTSGYELPEALAVIAPQINVYLPDFKYLSPELSARYSHAADYPDFAKASLAMMAARLGSARFDESGMMTRGIIVRHLLLPGQLRESMRVLDYLYGEYGNSIYYSLMSQYTPLPTLPETYPELRRRVTTYEYQKLIDHACSLGITNGFIQDGRSAKESFIPAFNGEGVE